MKTLLRWCISMKFPLNSNWINHTLISKSSEFLKFHKFSCKVYSTVFLPQSISSLGVGTILLFGVLQYIPWTSSTKRHSVISNCSITQKGLKCVISMHPHSFCSLILGEPPGSQMNTHFLHKSICLLVIPLGYKHNHSSLEMSSWPYWNTPGTLSCHIRSPPTLRVVEGPHTGVLTGVLHPSSQPCQRVNMWINPFGSSRPLNLPVEWILLSDLCWYHIEQNSHQLSPA